jgi:phage terminase small subunit
MKKKQLTKKQSLFCQKYIEFKGNGTKSYRSVYGGSENACAANAVRMIRNDKIKAELARLTAEIHPQELDIRTRILNELDKAAFSDQRELTSPKWNEKIKALELRAKIEGMMIDKVDMKSNVTFKLVDDDDDS